MPISKQEIGLYAKLGRSKAVRQAEHLSLAEGANAVNAALTAGLTCISVMITDNNDLIPAHWPHVEAISVKDMARIATTDSPPRVIGLFQTPFSDLNQQTPSPQMGEYWLCLAGVQDPGNAGTLIRALRAFGGTGVITTPGTVDLYSPKVIRASAGEVFICGRHQDIDVSEVWQLDSPVWSTRATNAKTYTDIEMDKGGLLVLGQEGNGIDPSILNQLTKIQWISVPQSPAVDSLNVAMCGGIIMSRWYK